MVELTENAGNYGAWGHLPEVKLVKIGTDNFSLYYTHWDGGWGYMYRKEILYSLMYDKVVFAVSTGEDHSGAGVAQDDPLYLEVDNKIEIIDLNKLFNPIMESTDSTTSNNHWRGTYFYNFDSEKRIYYRNTRK